MRKNQFKNNSKTVEIFIPFFDFMLKNVHTVFQLFDFIAFIGLVKMVKISV